MALERDRTSIVMSIRPDYAAAILDGSKTVEFRRRRLADTIETVFIYATAPVRKIVGAFAVSKQITDSPDKLWSDYHPVGGIEYESYLDYFEASEAATGILIEDLISAPYPISLSQAFGFSRPPQSYQYVTEDRATALLDSMRESNKKVRATA